MREPSPTQRGRFPFPPHPLQKVGSHSWRPSSHTMMYFPGLPPETGFLKVGEHQETYQEWTDGDSRNQAQPAQEQTWKSQPRFPGAGPPQGCVFAPSGPYEQPPAKALTTMGFKMAARLSPTLLALGDTVFSGVASGFGPRFQTLNPFLPELYPCPALRRTDIMLRDRTKPRHAFHSGILASNTTPGHSAAGSNHGRILFPTLKAKLSMIRRPSNLLGTFSPKLVHTSFGGFYILSSWW